MINTWQYIIITITMLPISGNVGEYLEYVTLNVWQSIEMLAEEYPYTVALISKNKDYLCTGVSIGRSKVLTTANCLTLNPTDVVIGQAIINKFIHPRHIFNIKRFVLHPEFAVSVESSAPLNIVVHSNIGLVITYEQDFQLFFSPAQTATFFIEELQDRTFTTVGYGNLSFHNVVALQQMTFKQKMCANSKWYYCVCGVEASSDVAEDHEFGEGGPVMLDGEVIAIASFPCGMLDTIASRVQYNVFTILGPYLSWLERQQNVSLHTIVSTGNTLRSYSTNFVVILIFSSILNV